MQSLDFYREVGRLNKEQQKTERNSIIQTSVFSIFSPLIFVFAIFLGFGHIVNSSLITQLIAGIFIFLVPILYYLIVMRPRRNDYFIDSNTRRIKISLIIQITAILVCFVLPFGYMIFFTQPENGHWDGNAVLYLLAALIAPIIIHIGGNIVRLSVKLLKFLLKLR